MPCDEPPPHAGGGSIGRIGQKVTVTVFEQVLVPASQTW